MIETEINDFLDCGSIIDTVKGKCLIGWGTRTWLYKPASDIAFYFPDFFLSANKSWFTHEFTAEVSQEELLHLLKQQNHTSQNSITWKNYAKPQFQKVFESLQAKFKTGTLQKGVPYIFEEAHGDLKGLKLSHSLQSLLSYAIKYPVFPYGFWSENEGMLGATPELLFRITGNTLETVACAGTCTLEEADDILHDVKQLYEHNLVVEGIRDSLSPLGDFQKGDTFVQKYTKLCHLITPINVKLQQTVTTDQVTQLIHPTPALGAYPRVEGMKWLREFDREMPRERFGAPVGFTRKGESTCYVAIRNVQWKDFQLKLGAGCGIVPASQFESEWNEILLKLKSIKNILAL
jgi:menaquinone-specific isochorismate synthase